MLVFGESSGGATHCNVQLGVRQCWRLPRGLNCDQFELRILSLRTSYAFATPGSQPGAPQTLPLDSNRFQYYWEDISIDFSCWSLQSPWTSLVISQPKSLAVPGKAAVMQPVAFFLRPSAKLPSAAANHSPPPPGPTRNDAHAICSSICMYGNPGVDRLSNWTISKR